MPTHPSKKRRNQLDPVVLARKIVDQATHVTDRAVQQLGSSLPMCKVDRTPPA